MERLWEFLSTYAGEFLTFGHLSLEWYHYEGKNQVKEKDVTRFYTCGRSIIKIV